MRVLFFMILTRLVGRLFGSGLYVTLGRLAAETGRIRIAERALQKALSLEEKKTPRRTSEIVTILENLGKVWLVPGRSEEARSVFERAIQLNASLPSLWDGLARALRLSNLDAEAEAPQRRALELRKSRLGADHKEVLDTFTSLAQLISDLGRHDEAAELLTQVVQTLERLHGPQDGSLVAALGNLAIVLDQKGDFRQAEALYQRAVDIEKTVLKGPGVAGVKIEGHRPAISHEI